MIWNALDRYRDLGLLIARIGFGLGLFYYHGLPKLIGGPERWARTGDAVENLGISGGLEWWGLAAALAEGVGGLLIAAGLFFRPTAFVVMTVMIVASVNHIATGEGTPSHAVKNAWLFAGLVLIGPGRYSLDAVLSARKIRKRLVRLTGPPKLA